MAWDPTLAFTEIDLAQRHFRDMRKIATVLHDRHQILQQYDFEILEKLAREALGTTKLFE